MNTIIEVTKRAVEYFETENVQVIGMMIVEDSGNIQIVEVTVINIHYQKIVYTLAMTEDNIFCQNWKRL